MLKGTADSHRFGLLRRTQKPRRRSPRTTGLPTSCEVLNARRLLSATGSAELSELDDDFDDPASIADWQRVNRAEGWNADQLQQWDIDQTHPGRMVMHPHTSVWYQDWRGPMVFKEVSGDFVFTTQIEISDRDDLGDSDDDAIPDDAAYSLGGLMIRTPRPISDPATDWQPGSRQDDGTTNGENYVFLSLGHGVDGQFSFEVKTTRNSRSDLELTPLGQSTSSATLRIARIGETVVTMYQLPGADWVVHRRYTRPDMPESLQLGLVTYSDWNKASDFTPLVHNSTVLQPGVTDPTPEEAFNPDLVASFDYARFRRPVVPAELTAVDLVNEASDAQLLSFLGDEPADPPASNQAPQVEEPAAVSVLVDSDPITVDIAGHDPDGDELAWDVRIEQSVAASIMAEHQLREIPGRDDYALNWGGQSEKWLQGDNGWYFLLPDGSLNHWQGTFASSSQLATFSDAEYDDPQRVLQAATPDLDVAIDSGRLIITPGSSTGMFDVVVSVSDNHETVETSFAVSVVNSAPTISVADQVATAGETLSIALPETDVDGQAIAWEVEVIGDELSALDDEHVFWSSGEYYTSYHGRNERWIQDSSSRWHYLLPDGALHRWEGSFESSPLIAQLDATVYSDPTRLTEPQPAPVVATITDGELRVTADAGYNGTVQVRLRANDGYATTSATFAVQFQSINNDALFSQGDGLLLTS